MAKGLNDRAWVSQLAEPGIHSSCIQKSLSFEVRWIWGQIRVLKITISTTLSSSWVVYLTTLSLSVQIEKNGPSAQVTVMIQGCNSCLLKSFKKPSTILTACQGLDECWPLWVKTTSGPVALQASLIQSICGSGPEVKAISCVTFFPVPCPICSGVSSKDMTFTHDLRV